MAVRLLINQGVPFSEVRVVVDGALEEQWVVIAVAVAVVTPEADRHSLSGCDAVSAEVFKRPNCEDIVAVRTRTGVEADSAAWLHSLHFLSRSIGESNRVNEYFYDITSTLSRQRKFKTGR